MLQGFLHALGLLIGLALIVHGYLCLTLRCWGLGDCLVGIIGIGQRTAFLRAELQVHRGGYTLLVGHSVEFDGLALQVVTLLLVGELHALPLADGLDVAVLVRPLWTALFLCTVTVGILCLALCLLAAILLLLLSVTVAVATGYELHTFLFDVGLQGGGELATVGKFNLLVLQGQSGTEHVLFLLSQFRVAYLLRNAQTAHGQVCNLVGLAVDADDAWHTFASLVQEVNDTSHVAVVLQG